MTVVASTFSNNLLSKLQAKNFLWIYFRLQHSSRICLSVREHLHSLQSGWLSPVSRYLSNTCITNVKSSHNDSIMTTEMCDAAVIKVRFDRVQFIRRASIPFGLPDFTIVLSDKQYCTLQLL